MKRAVSAAGLANCPVRRANSPPPPACPCARDPVHLMTGASNNVAVPQERLISLPGFHAPTEVLLDRPPPKQGCVSSRPLYHGHIKGLKLNWRPRHSAGLEVCSRAGCRVWFSLYTITIHFSIHIARRCDSAQATNASVLLVLPQMAQDTNTAASNAEFPASEHEAREHIRQIRRDKGLGDGPDQIGNNASDLESALQV